MVNILYKAVLIGTPRILNMCMTSSHMELKIA